MFNIGELAKGALVERADVEIKNILENIANPNTNYKKARKLTLTLTFKPIDEEREQITVEMQAKSSIQPYKEINTMVYLGEDTKGNLVAEELFSKNAIAGQMNIDPETGEIKESKIVNIK